MRQVSKRNRQRRQEKQRRQRRAAAGRMANGAGWSGASWGPSSASASASGGSSAWGGSGAAGLDAEHANYLFVKAASAAIGGFGSDDDVELLADQWSVNDVVPTVTAHCLELAVAGAWPNGWQPADLRRVVARRLSASHAQLAVHIMAADAERYRDRVGADAGWLAQLDGMGARRWWTTSRPHLDEWARREGVYPETVLLLAVQLFALLHRLPRLHRFCVPPDEWGTSARFSDDPVAGRSIDPKILARIRALLAKAESTTFPEEAEALTAKAQELIARHAVEAALLEEGQPRATPVARRLGVDDPYASAKAYLLAQVAAASRCRAVWSGDLGFSTVFGFPAELDAVELLYTSLLVQATSAMVAEGKRPEQRRQRTRGFRQSFLVAFAARIGQRLRETTEAVVSEADSTSGGALLPVLASRREAIDEAVDEAFPDASGRSLSASDRDGWIAGRVAADMASLAVGRALPDGGG
jgi:hypothetical protein